MDDHVGLRNMSLEAFRALSQRVREREGDEGLSRPPLTRQARPERLPLSFAQERLWFLEQLGVGTSYTMPNFLRLEGPLDVGALEASLGALVARHEPLRTRFAVRDGEPVQVIDPPGPFELTVRDLGGLEADAREAKAQALQQAEIERPFDLERGPLFRAELLRLGPQDHVLLMSMHHILSDGWSLLGIIPRELGALYEAFLEGRPSPLAPLEVQYADYALWQRQWLRDEALERQLAYWRERLAGAPPVLELPTDRPRPPVESFRGAALPFTLPGTLSEGVRELARREGVTPFMVFLAAFQVLVSRWSGQTDVVVGSAIAGRDRRELEPLVGFFVNTLALRTDLSGDPSFRTLLGRVKETTLGAYAHQDLPFEKLVAELAPERDLGRHPIFQTMVTFNNVPHEDLELRDLSWNQVGGRITTAKFDLELHLFEGLGIDGFFEYATDLYEASTIERLLEGLTCLLEGALGDPDQALSALPVLGSEQARRLAVEWNATASDYPRDRPVHALFSEQAGRAPQATALALGEATMSYGELEARSNQLAWHLKARGVGPEVVVGLCLERSFEMVVGLLAILKAGGAYLPLDPDYPAERLAFMLADAGAALTLSAGPLWSGLGLEGPAVLLDEEAQAIAARPDQAPPPAAGPLNLAYVIYTSGSTGSPKGVGMTHGAIVNLLTAPAMAYPASVGPVLQLTPLHFDVSVQEIFLALTRGARLVLVDAAIRQDPERLVECLDRWRVRHLFCPQVLLEQLALAWRRSRPDLALSEVYQAGEALVANAAILEMIAASQARLINHYGPTETHAASSFVLPSDGVERHAPIGRPIANVQLYVLDGELGLAPIGVAGELYIAGDGLARGYLGRPGLTAERFVANPYGPAGSRLYRTGDLVRWRQGGELEFLGRLDHQVKVRGHRIELGEVEAVLLEQPGVAQAVAVVREDAPGDRRLTAYVVGRDLDAGDLRARVRARSPGYMVPSAIVVLDQLPLTASGKVDRQALPAPEERPELIGDYVVPSTPLEEALAAIWAETLRLDRVGAQDNFFDLGGHSLLATQVVSRVREALQVELPVRAFFEAPTVRQLAQRVEVAQKEQEGLSRPPLTRQARPERLPLSFAQERLWFLEQLGVGTSYTMPNFLRLEGPLDVGALEASLGALVARHEPLRTRFAVRDGEPVQVIDPPGPFELTVRDLGGLEADAREAKAQALQQAEIERPFDLERGPLFRAELLRLGPQDHVLLMSMHHILSDGWSLLGIIPRELGALYEAFLEGRPSPLAPLEVQYADYALWQRQWLRDEALERQLAYWRERLAGAPPVLELPTDRPRPPVESFRGAALPFTLPGTLSEGVRELARREGVTPFMVFLAAFQVLVSRWSGQTDVVVGSAIAGRDRRELEPLVGFFVNTLALRTDLSGDPSFRTLLGRVKETTLGAYAHQDLPFEKLVAELAPERDLGRHPLVQVVVALHNVPEEGLRLEGLTLKRAGGEHVTAKFDLALHLFENDALWGFFEYATDLYEASTIERLLEGLTCLLEGALGDPDQALSALPVLGSEQARRLAVEWNATASDYPRDRPVHALFSEQAGRAPQATALALGEATMSYGELEARSNQLAWHLKARGVGPEVVVGLCLERSFEMVVGLLAILKAGGAYLPLDPDYPAERLRFMLDDAGAMVVVTTQAIADGLPAYGVLPVLLDEEAQAIAARPDQAPPPAAGPLNLAYVIYTSGSTGSPKGVGTVHRNIARLVLGADYADLARERTLLLISPLTFDAATFELWGALLHGARLVLQPPGPIDIGQLRQVMTTQGVDLPLLTTGLLHRVVEEDISILGGVRQVLTGGDALSPSHARQIVEAIGPGRLINGYGPTEGTTYSTVHAVGELTTATVPIGRPIANTQVYVLDGELGLAPIGVAGELYIAGDGLARGYLGRPGLTAERFVANPYGPAGSRLYRTGDLVRWRQGGELEFLGRLDHQVKVRGHRIELGEVEAVLLEQPGVAQAVAVVREDAPGDKRLVAYVVAEAQGLKAAHAQAYEEAREENVEQWETLFDDAYGASETAAAPSFRGWNSSYTGAAIPLEQMREWRDQTLERIQDLEPGAILEIGCGVGLLLEHLAAGRDYTGTDISAAALGGLQRWLDEQPALSHVRLLRREATQFEGWEAGAFDTVVLNSIIQYFPDGEYLLSVLSQALDLVGPQGQVFVGDVRQLDLIKAFHASVQLDKAPAGLSVGRLKARVARAMAQDKELLVAPGFFEAAREQLGVGQVRALLKRGRYVNELTGYRYDVILSRQEQARYAAVELEGDDQALERLDEQLAQHRPARVRVRGVANHRLAQDAAAARLMETMEENASVAQLREALKAHPARGQDPEAFWALAQARGYQAQISWSGGGEGRFDVELVDPGQVQTPLDLPAEPAGAWSEHVNDPLLGQLTQQLGARLREALKAKVPDYMTPSAILALDQLPLTANGKVDRQALPAPEERPELIGDYVVPSTPLEEALAAIWAETLRLDRVGAQDNFFDLGGHSLLATQVVSRVREALQVELPVRAFFEAPTVRQLAQRVEVAQKEQEGLSRPPLTRQARPERLPLSFAQERLWFLEQLGVGTSYTMPNFLRLEGPLDVGALEASLGALVARHEPLRTRFAVRDGEPVQVIDPPGPFELTVRDLGGLEADAREAKAQALQQAEIERPFDLERGPLFRAELLRLGPQDHVLLMSMHHILSDGWSLLGIIPRELGALYEAFLEGRPSPLAPLEVQYADYALWQRQWLRDEALERQLAYWRERLAGAPPVLELPTDRPRPPVESFRGAALPFTLPGTLSEGVRELARREGVTPFMVFLAAFQVLVSRWSGQTDVVVGSAIAGRDRRELEPLVGFFVNTLALRTDLSGDPSFRTLLGRVKETTLGAYAHQDLPFEKLVAELAPERDLGRHPLVQVVVALHNVPSEALRLEGLQWRPTGGEHVTAKFDLTLHLFENDALWGFFEYATDLYEASTIERLLEGLTCLLEGALGDPDQALSALPVLGSEQARRLAVEWNATASDYPRDRPVHALFSEQAGRAPQATALALGEATMSYGELEARSNQLAWHLKARGVGPEVVVGLCLERSFEMVVGLLAILKAGGAYLPLDPDYPAERLAFMLADAGAALTLSAGPLWSGLGLEGPAVLLDEEAQAIAGRSDQAPPPAAGPLNLAYVIYTSGSTGSPKGVGTVHRNIARLVLGADYADLARERTLLLISPLTFDAATFELWGALLHGARLVLQPPGPIDIGQLRQVMTTQGVDLPLLTTGLLHRVVEEDISILGGVRQVLTGGDALSPSHARQIVEAIGPGRLINGYGPTEGTTYSTVHAVGELTTATVPIGRPIANTQVYVLDGELGLAPIGVAGELYIAGDGLARGYLGRPGLTAERFVANPYGPAGSRLYRTGDLVRWRQGGELEFLGRLDHQVKVRGHRIELGEVEAVLLEQPGVAQAVAVVREDAPGDKRLVAYVVAEAQGLKAAHAQAYEEAREENVEQWETLFDDAYGASETAAAPSFRGWNSSYTGAAIPLEQMREWRDQTLERIQDLEPGAILEIGCGVGLLLEHLAAGRDYTGTDISAAALGGLQRWLDEQPALSHVRLLRREATQFEGWEAGAFDTVVLNSIIQYFPDGEYLLSVLSQALDLVGPQGQVFVGDVRQLDLIKAFHASVQLDKAPAGLSVGRLKARVARAMAQDKELLVAPGFFEAAREQLGVGQVRALLKRGRYVNELTGYRYDVILSRQEQARYAAVELEGDDQALERLDEQLAQHRPARVRVRGVANHRLAQDAAAARLMETMEENASVAQLREALKAHPARGQDPEAFWALAQARGYQAQISWSGGGEGRFDVELVDPGQVQTPLDLPAEPAGAWSEHVNDPLLGQLTQQLGARLREALKAKVPDYMTPSAILALDQLPLTANGKVDRQALPAPEERPELIGDYVVPSTPLEEALAAIWAETLRLDRVGAQDNFFDLGGHSLLATQVVSRVREALQVELPVRAFFEAPTVRQLAQRVEVAHWLAAPTARRADEQWEEYEI
ncbi:non-ribosomal peptide synthetase [Caulobacter rhizosphaerae]|uniref:non-ribosomal peptide synthetase n=1 Tax=Caulobacter rhizosphaerae TaxID=2010972 RepID=UPI0013D84E5C|nr:non-ribosomal peptide synthetase [Caulobacter rhizosphaerae]